MLEKQLTATCRADTYFYFLTILVSPFFTRTSYTFPLNGTFAIAISVTPFGSIGG
jgi:hypothetical protein